MPAPAREKWWDKVFNGDSYKLANDTYLLWGDRVRVLKTHGDECMIAARGRTGTISKDLLGDETLLECYFIDVGQGDGVLVVTPEGHHLLIDGGLRRRLQQTRKSAADFVDWKFYYDYLPAFERSDATKNQIHLDAMIASHGDRDHYGGLDDLADRKAEETADELNTTGISVEAFYHPGLGPAEEGSDELGTKVDGFFVDLLGDRDSAVEAVKSAPSTSPTLRGEWRDFIKRVLQLETKSGDETPFARLSQESEFLPGFSANDTSSELAIQVLSPIEQDVGGNAGLRDLGDEGVNKNGHSIALRLQYKDRSILLTGDLNDKAQGDIIEHYGASFATTWRSDVTKACHHGSHHVRHDFLVGVNALSTVFSSGDANTYDHPRAWVLGAAALSGRVIEDSAKHRLVAPLIYSTEIARSIALKGVDQLRGYDQEQQYGREDASPSETVSGDKTRAKWRLVLDRSSKSAADFPPVPAARVMRKLIYGLVNVRTDGKRLLFAVRNEGNASWAYEVMEADQIAGAVSKWTD